MQINGEASHDSSYNTKKEKMSMGTNSRLDFKTGSSDITHSGLIPIYEPGSGYFTIRMHHGGTFNFSQPTVYVGGSVLHCDYCSIKNLSFGLLDSTSKLLGYGSVASCVFTDPAVGLADGLTAIVDRGDMKELAKFGITHGFVDVYLVGTDGVGLHGAGTNYSLGFNDDVPAIRATSQLGNVPPSQAAKKGSRDDGKCPGPITSHSPKKENKRVQKKVQNNELGLLPPKELKIGGRPPKARKKGAIEREELKNKNIKGEVEKASRVGKMNPYKCSECKQPGHTVKTCPTKRASSEPQPQPTPKSVPKKMKKAQVCSSCKKPGHNMITCPTAISARYKFPLNHSEPLEVQK